MYLVFYLPVLLLLGVTSGIDCAAAHQETLIDVSSLIKTEGPITSENSLFSIPLNDSARTGAIPLEQEELIISR